MKDPKLDGNSKIYRGFAVLIIAFIILGATAWFIHLNLKDGRTALGEIIPSAVEVSHVSQVEAEDNGSKFEVFAEESEAATEIRFGTPIADQLQPEPEPVPEIPATTALKKIEANTPVKEMYEFRGAEFPIFDYWYLIWDNHQELCVQSGSGSLNISPMSAWEIGPTTLQLIWNSLGAYQQLQTTLIGDTAIGIVDTLRLGEPTKIGLVYTRKGEVPLYAQVVDYSLTEDELWNILASIAVALDETLPENGVEITTITGTMQATPGMETVKWKPETKDYVGIPVNSSTRGSLSFDIPSSFSVVEINDVISASYGKGAVQAEISVAPHTTSASLCISQMIGDLILQQGLAQNLAYSTNGQSDITEVVQAGLDVQMMRAVVSDGTLYSIKVKFRPAVLSEADLQLPHLLFDSFKVATPEPPIETE